MSDGKPARRIADPDRLAREAMTLVTMTHFFDHPQLGRAVRAKWQARWYQIGREMNDQAKEALRLAGIGLRTVEREDGLE